MVTGPAHSQEKGTLHVKVRPQRGVLGDIGELHVSRQQKTLVRGSCCRRLGLSQPGDSRMGSGGPLSLPLCGDRTLEDTSANPLFLSEGGGWGCVCRGYGFPSLLALDVHIPLSFPAIICLGQHGQTTEPFLPHPLPVSPSLFAPWVFGHLPPMGPLRLESPCQSVLLATVTPLHSTAGVPQTGGP